MPAVAERTSAHLEGYDAFATARAGQPDHVTGLRRRGLDHFTAAGFPTTRDEEWRKTNVARIARGTFAHAPGVIAEADRALVERFYMKDYSRLVFVNGGFVPALSQVDDLPAGVVVCSLAEAIEKEPSLVERELGRHAPVDATPFSALNAAYLDDGAFVHVPRGVVVERPIHLLFVGTSDGAPTVSYPRNLIVAEALAQVTVIEDYAGFGDQPYFTCPVTEIVCHQRSIVDHYKLQQESTGAFHVALQQSWQARDANLFSHSISHGAALARNDIRANLDGEGIECTLNGLYLTRGGQHVDHHMYVDHAKPNCHSYELYKGVLEGASRAVFNGTIHVREDAQKTDAKQSNRNLLLSADAMVSSNPQLRIFADDVRCTHGSTTGHLEEEAIFYLRSRGIGEEAAKSLLTYAFAAEVLQEIRLAPLRKDLEEFLFTRLPKGHVVRQAV